MLIAVTIVQLLAALVLILIVLFQSGKSQGLSGAIGGIADSYMSKGKARTIDAKLAKATKWVGAVFVILTLVLDCMVAGIHFCCSGFFCACGLSGLSFLHNCISIVAARIPLAWLACRYFPETLYPMGLAAPIGSLISVAICLIALRWIRQHPEKLIMNLHPVETE